MICSSVEQARGITSDLVFFPVFKKQGSAEDAESRFKNGRAFGLSSSSSLSISFSKKEFS